MSTEAMSTLDAEGSATQLEIQKLVHDGKLLVDGIYCMRLKSRLQCLPTRL